MGLTRLAVHRPLTILMGLFGLVLMGGVAYTYLTVDRLPPITIGFVFVSVPWAQASATDVEALVVEPLENAISGMEGVSQMNSNSSEGSGSVSVQLADGVDPNAAALEIGRRVNAIRNRLPADAGDATVNKIDPNAQPIMDVALTGAPLDQLFDIANTQMVPALESVVGVGSVNISGGLQRQYTVQVNYAKLAAYGVSPAQVTTALAASNLTSPVGSIPIGSKNQDLRAVASLQSLSDIRNVVITQTTNGPVLVNDVATVAEGYKDQYQLQRLDGQNAVGLSIVKTSGANAVQVADDIQKTLDKERAIMPPGTVIQVTNDQSIFTRAALNAIQHDLIVAIGLVALVILLFLHDWRHTIIVLLAIPSSLISTFLFMWLFGFTLNIMTLMALALMIGILVDDSIVVLENIHRHLQLGESPWQAALKGRSEIGLAAIAITMADVVVYTPIAFMQGQVGQLFKEYGLTVVVATLLSLMVSFTLTPMLASRWLTHDHLSMNPLARFGRWWDRGFSALGRFVAATVPWTIRMRWLVLVATVAVVGLVASMLPTGLLKTEYAPQEDDNIFSANLNMPPGTGLLATDAAAQQLEGILASFPEVQHYFTSVSIPGGIGGSRGGGGHTSIDVQLVDKSLRSRSIFDIMNLIRARARSIPNANFGANVQSAIGGGGGGGLTSVNIQVTGPDLDTLNQVAAQVGDVALTVPGVTDLSAGNSAGNPEFELKLDRARMGQLGITAQQVTTALRTAVGGTVATQLRPVGKVAEDITVVASSTDRNSLSALLSVPVGTQSNLGGATAGPASAGPTVVTLGQVATVANGTGPVSIQRTNRNRTVTISAIANGRPLGDVANDLKSTLAAKVPFPAGYTFNIGGQVQQLNTALAQLASALTLSVILQYMLLVALYESFLFPLVRMLTIPLGLVGAFILLFLTGNTINIYSIIGMLMAQGLVAKSGILLVDYANTLRQRGMGRTEALAESTRVRLRPILMTTCTMVFGMIPMALKLEAGAESRSPMALVVIGSLISSTLLTLVVIPALYTMFDDLQNLFSRRQSMPKTEVLVSAGAAGPAYAGAGASHTSSTISESNGDSGTPRTNGDADEVAAPRWLQRLRGGRGG